MGKIAVLIVNVIDTVAVQNLLASFRCVLGKIIESIFSLLGVNYHRRTSQKKFGGKEVLPNFVTFAQIMIF